MTEDPQTALPSSFKIIAGVALAWNILGLIAYLMDVMMSPEAVAALPEAERTLRDSMPVWATAGYATAVHAGTFGSLGLVLKKAWSVPLLIASLAGIVVQQIYIFFMSNAIEVYGAATMVFPVLVLLIGIYLVWYSRSAKQKGWIS
jgi:hypothetical protein